MKKTIFFLFFISFFSTLFADGYEISIKVSGLESKEVYLGFYYADKTYVKDTTKLDATGSGVFKGDKKLDGGVYFLVTPRKSIGFEMLIGDEQKFSMSTDTLDYVNKMKIKNSPENEHFYDYQKFISQMNKKMESYQQRLKANEKNADSTKIIKEKIQVLHNSVVSEWKRIVTTYPGTFFCNIIKAQMEPEVPDFKVDDSVKNKDSVLNVKQYYYNKNHFFDNFEFSDDRILRSSLYYNKLNRFFTQMIFSPDTVNTEGDKIIEKSKINHDMYRYTLEYLLNLPNQTKRMNFDRVMVHFGEKYYMNGQTDWVDSSRMEKIKERVILSKPNLIGNKAIDMKLVTSDNNIKTLYSINAKFTIVAFWEPSCGHCKKEIPKLHEVYQKIWQQGVECLAVFTQVQEKDEWLKFIDDNGLTDWINAYDPYGWAKFRNNYDVISTPTIYILNEKKEIIAKRIAVEQIEDFIKSFSGDHPPSVN